VAALALLASAACSSGGGERGSAGAGATVTVATEPPRTNPTLATLPPVATTIYPNAVPSAIDVAYVDRVLAGLDAQLGDVTRILMRTNTFPSEAFDRLKAIYANNESLQLKLDAFQADLRLGFAGYKSSPGNKLTNATKIITASRSCIFVEVRRDYAAVTNTTPVSHPQLVALQPSDPLRDPSKYNPTGWAFAYDGAQPDRTQPPNPCAN
jgi:hypothetical protein